MDKNINNFKVIGISHHLANVELREQFALSDEDIHIIHQHLGDYTNGGFVLSTCNRTEIYFVANQVQSLIKSWASLANVETGFLQQYLYQFEGKHAVDYLFQVGTGLDSQILGDFQIIGQIKTAYQRAMEDGSANNEMTRMIDMLLKTSKRVKNETLLSSGVASMAYAGIQYVERELSGLDNQTALVYGAGKMGSSVVRKLAELMPTEQVLLANRTSENAQELADKYEIQNVSEESLAKLVEKSDFLISTAAVDEPVFTKKLLENVNLNGKVFVDLSMPRSIQPELKEEKGLQLLNLDYLQDVQNETFELRKQSIPQAKKIVAEELNDFYNWIQTREIAPTIHALKQKLNVVKEAEMKKLLKTNTNINERQLETLAQALINKVTTQCVKHIKRHNGTSKETIHDIFEIETSAE